MRLSRVSPSQLTLPDKLTARARDRLCGMFLFHEFLTNGTGSLPHIQTWLLVTKAAYNGKNTEPWFGCLFLFVQMLHFRRFRPFKSPDLLPDLIQS